MKKFVRIFALIMALCLLLCACGEEKPVDTGDTKPSETRGSETTVLSGTSTPTETDPVDDGKKTYTVTILDQNGNPVAGVSVQFCDENNTCQLPVKTNDQGIVTKRLPEMVYHVTLTLPEGYTCDTLEYNLEGTTELTVTVNAG